MKSLFLFVLLACVSLVGGQLDAKTQAKIRVLLAKEARGVLLESRGGYKVLHKEDILSKGSVGKRYVVHALADGLRWGEEFPDVYAISIQPEDEGTSFYVDGIQYKGSIDVVCTKKGCVNVINEVAVEDFVKSTLALKINSPLSHEAACAMAIAERTNAFATVYYKDAKALWDVCAEDVDYYGFGVTFAKNGVDKAVAFTDRIVLEDKQGKPMKNIEISLNQAEELASRGLDAKKILRNAVPLTEMTTSDIVLR